MNLNNLCEKKNACQPHGTRKVRGNFQRERLSQPTISEKQNEAKGNFVKVDWANVKI